MAGALALQCEPLSIAIHDGFGFGLTYSPSLIGFHRFGLSLNLVESPDDDQGLGCDLATV
jgi:hypothetical protein